MLKVTKILKVAIPYIGNNDVREKVNDILESHDTDLQDVGYEESSTTEELVKDLEALINNIDESTADARVALKEAQAEAREALEREELEEGN